MYAPTGVIASLPLKFIIHNVKLTCLVVTNIENAINTIKRLTLFVI